MNRSTPAMTSHDDYTILMPAYPDKDEKSRLGYFINWLRHNRLPWHEPDLAAYRDYMLYERKRVNSRTGQERSALLSPATVQAHLATIRGRYDALLRTETAQQRLRALAPDDISDGEKDLYAQQALARLQRLLEPEVAPVKDVVGPDVADGEFVRLSPDQIAELVRAPGLRGLRDIRDTAIIATMICTGIREAELSALQIDDLTTTPAGTPALRIHDNQGGHRLLVCEPMAWFLPYIDLWLRAANLEDGPLFRGLYRGQRRIRHISITTRSINRIMNRYPIDINGQRRDVKPHDLRRTYARNAYVYGLSLARIQHNLGHTHADTTRTYIGVIEPDATFPQALLQMPHSDDDLRAACEAVDAATEA